MCGRVRRKRALLALAPIAALVTGCGSQQDALSPASHQAKDIASLFWWMMGASWIGLLVVVALLFWAWRRKDRRGLGNDTEGVEPGERAAWRVVVGAGVVFPILLLGVLFVISDIFVIKTTEAPAANATRMTIRVVGHQWWWQVFYPGTDVVTANEIHIPAKTPVRVEVQTADVIHSFWVPELNRTIDTIPGRTNVIELYAEQAGRYRGQCDEFCGLQHAHMAFYVFADPPAVFRRWLANQEKPAVKPRTPLEREGEQVFVNGPCSACHSIRGVSTVGDTGPDLTHLASRTTLGALATPNRKGYLAGWILDSQNVKPGNQMPDIALSGPRLQALLAYLETLR